MASLDTHRSRSPAGRPHIAASLFATLLGASVPASASVDDTLLPPVVVEGQRDSDTYVATTSTSGTRTDTPIIETPQSISVVTRKQIDDQKPRSISEALNYTPGVFTGVVGATNRYDYAALRGFTETETDNILLDGLKLLSDPGSFSSMQFDPYFVDRIDVLRGPASALYGRNAPGGVVALTSKQPLFTPHGEAAVTLGNMNRREASLDVTGPVGDSKQVAYRLTALGRTLDSQFDHVEEGRYAIAPSLAIDFTSDTRLLLQAYLQHDPNGGYHAGVPANATITNEQNGSYLPRSFFDGDTNYNEFRRTERMIGYQFEHAFNEAWRIKQNFRYLSSDLDLKQVYSAGWAGPSELNRYYSGAEESLRGWIVDNQVQGRFDTGPVAHTFVAGFDYQDRQVRGYWDSAKASNLDVFAPDHGNATLDGFTRTPVDRRLTQAGFYAQDQLAIDRWRLQLGVREDLANISNLAGPDGARSEYDGANFTKRAGVVYLFDNGIAPYASYAESFNPSGFTDANGQLLDPTESRQYEIGVRYEPVNTRSLFSAAVFDLTQQNVATRVPSNVYYVPAGTVRSRGLELEAHTQLSERFGLLASYTYTDIRYVEASASLKGRTPYQVPRHMASLWGNYAFPAGLDLGAGIRYIGSSWADNENTLRVPAYVLFDLSLRADLARLNPSLKGATLSLNAHNLFDNDYVASCASLNYCYAGEARTVTATFAYTW
jgi:iron complex outermembrane receptor protein